jgi:pyruvate,orthophosphate dikinase
MIPLVAYEQELEAMRGLVERVAAEEGNAAELEIGTMIEVPRAAVTADEIAQSAQFFSFGTNDLTQMTFGYSRDDVNSFLPDYLKKEILERDPFQSLDVGGVGKLVAMAVKLGRGVNATLKLGICGEHGGDPRSVEFCHRVGLNYVSCSPFRVPIARLAAAQAAIKDTEIVTTKKTTTTNVRTMAAKKSSSNGSAKASKNGKSAKKSSGKKTAKRR